ncbi:common pilus major fimbrillin subunit EcpA [Yersinia mollaretii]|uniref:common pilus major fimbrillin subunit EcpA n=1 Tax=Yersinia mollaretii TaxID=33060 RepID=UPI00119C943C|nr:common pilus major fimbrillin subunit EcpA [Yersinia mollaretii]
MKSVSMKKNAVAAMVVMSIFAATNVAHAATVEKTATATWAATAIKTTTAALSVVSDDLATDFTYSAVDGFSTVDAPFTLTVTGEGSATAFKLTANTTGANKLTSADTTSTLNVQVSKGSDPLPISGVPGVTLFDSATALHTPEYDGLLTGYNKNSDTDVLGKFKLSIYNPTSNGSTPVLPFALPNTTWSGDVGVQFTAVWTVPV